MASLDFEPENSDQIRYYNSVNQTRVSDPMPLKPHFQTMVEQCGFTEVAEGRGHHEYYSGRVFDLIGYRDTVAYAFTSPNATDKVGVVYTTRETLDAAIKAGRPSLYNEWRSEVMPPEQFVSWRRENDLSFEPKRDATKLTTTHEGFSFAHLPYKPAPLPGDSRIRETVALSVHNFRTRTTQSIGHFFHPAKTTETSTPSANISH